jgi:2-polyprenyl-3-methyl-5-hydroxy-6-metoxy-1,4-benzoquinol methylase
MECIICHNKKFRKLAGIHEIARWNKRKYPLYECKKCGFIRPSPLPYDNSNKLTVYDSIDNMKFYNKDTDDIYFTSKDYKYFFKHFRDYLNFVKKYHIRGSHLDVGCGTGHLLKLLKDYGMKSDGLEVSHKLARAVGKKFKVYCCDFNSENISKKYDLITMSQVLEHVEDPKKFLIDANNTLNSRGYLLLGFPIIRGLIPRILRSYWYGLGSGTHLNFFSEKNITLLLDKTGFEVIEMKRTTNDYTHIKFPRTVNLFARMVSKTIEFLGLGDNLFVVARKRL